MLSILDFKPRIFFVLKYDKIKRKKSFFCRKTKVKVISEGLNVRKGPLTQYDSIGKISKGYVFDAIGKSGSWY